MNLIGAKSFSVFLVSSLVSASSFRPLSFGKQVQQNQQCKWDDTKCLAARGGSTLSSATTTVLNSAVASEESAAPAEIFRSAYEPLPHLVSKINMDFQIDEGKTIVTSELFIEPNSSYNGKSRDLTLDGDETCVKLLSLSLNGKDLEEGTDYTLSPGMLILKNPPAGSLLKTVVEIVPEDNTQLSGLYKDGPMYCTQVRKEESQECTHHHRFLLTKTFVLSLSSVKQWASDGLHIIQTDQTIWPFSKVSVLKQIRKHTLFSWQMAT
jgi:hypothetical protein